MAGERFKEIRAFQENFFVEIEVVVVEGGGVAQAQEEENAGDAFLIKGEIFGDHAGGFQLVEIHQGANLLIQGSGVDDGGVAVGEMELDLAAGFRFHIPGNLQNPGMEPIKNRILKAHKDPLVMQAVFTVGFVF